MHGKPCVSGSSCRVGLHGAPIVQRCKYSRSLPKVKASLASCQEIKEIHQDSGKELTAEALEVCRSPLPARPRQVPPRESQSCNAYMQDNIFEWHFVIRGPPDTEFEVRA